MAMPSIRFRPVHLAGFFPLALIVASLAAPGCGSEHPELIAVEGRVTLDGGPWPKPGIVNFTPARPADGFPAQPGTGHFDVDGRFVARTGRYPGLLPGEYGISVTCWETEPGDNRPGTSYTPESFTFPAQSELHLKVAPGTSGPVVWEKDLPRASR